MIYYGKKPSSKKRINGLLTKEKSTSGNATTTRVFPVGSKRPSNKVLMRQKIKGT